MKLSTCFGTQVARSLLAVPHWLRRAKHNYPRMQLFTPPGSKAPRGPAFGADDALFIAEAGTVGTSFTEGIQPQAPGPVGPHAVGPTRRISRLASGKLSVLSAALSTTV